MGCNQSKNLRTIDGPTAIVAALPGPSIHEIQLLSNSKSQSISGRDLTSVSQALSRSAIGKMSSSDRLNDDSLLELSNSIQSVGLLGENISKLSEEVLDKSFKKVNVLGVGRDGTCYRVFDLRNNFRIVALKVCHHDTTQFHQERRELRAYEILGNHPGIIRVLEVIETPSRLAYVMELAPKDMFTRVVEGGPLSEENAAVVIRRLSDTLIYMHSLGVVHRDLKPENVLLVGGEETNVALCDFGSCWVANDEDRQLVSFVSLQTPTNSEGAHVRASSRPPQLHHYHDGSHMSFPVLNSPTNSVLSAYSPAPGEPTALFPIGFIREVAGTWAYAAPEQRLLQPRPHPGGSGELALEYSEPAAASAAVPVGHTNSADVWSLGVLLYVLLSGHHPFDVNADLPDAAVRANVRRGLFSFEDDAWSCISFEAKDLIRKMVDVNPSTRISLQTVLAHPWVRAAAAADDSLYWGTPIPKTSHLGVAATPALRLDLQAHAPTSCARAPFERFSGRRDKDKDTQANRVHPSAKGAKHALHARVQGAPLDLLSSTEKSSTLSLSVSEVTNEFVSAESANPSSAGVTASGEQATSHRDRSLQEEMDPGMKGVNGMLVTTNLSASHNRGFTLSVDLLSPVDAAAGMKPFAPNSSLSSASSLPTVVSAVSTVADSCSFNSAGTAISSSSTAAEVLNAEFGEANRARELRIVSTDELSAGGQIGVIGETALGSSECGASGTPSDSTLPQKLDAMSVLDPENSQVTTDNVGVQKKVAVGDRIAEFERRISRNDAEKDFVDRTLPSRRSTARTSRVSAK